MGNLGFDTTKPASPLLIAVSSDRGLCGGVHGAVSKQVKAYVREVPSSTIAVLGDKSRNQLQREFKNNFALSFNQLGSAVPTFYEASLVTGKILESVGTADSGASQRTACLRAYLVTVLLIFLS